MDKIVNLSLARKNVPMRIDVVQYATRPDIVFVLDDFTPAEGATASLYIEKPDGTKIYNACTIDENRVTYTPTTQSFAVTGKNKCQLQIIESGGVAVSFLIVANVTENIIDGSAIESSNEYGTLIDMANDIRVLESEVAQIISGASPVDPDAELVDIRVGYDGTTYPTAGDAVRGEDSYLDEYITSVDNDININLPVTYVEGEYVRSGVIETSPNYHRTDYIEVDSTKVLEIYMTGGRASSTYNAQFDENKNYISAFTLTEGYNERVLSPACKYVMLSDTKNVRFRVSYKDYENEKSIVDNIITMLKPRGILPYRPWWQGTINTSGNVTYNITRISSDFVEVDPGATLTLEFGDNPDGHQLSICEYDENKAYLRGSAYITGDRLFTLQPTTKYIRFLAKRSDNGNMPVYEASQFTIGVYTNTGYESNTLRVVTYNVGHWGYGTSTGIPDDEYDEKLTNYRRFFAKEDFDVVGMQEFSSTIDVDAEVGTNDALFNKFYPYSKDTGMQESLKTKNALTNSGQGQLSTGRWYVYGNIMVDGKSVYLLNVHLSVGTQNVQTRIDEANEIITTLLNNKERFIMFGDFNPEPDEEESLFNVFANEGYNLANCGWFGKYFTWARNRSDLDTGIPTGTVYYLDNIITSANIEIMNVEKYNIYSQLTSDHIPLMAKVVVN